MIFKDKIFEFFGHWKLYDSNKDVQGKGTMERFNEVVGEDIDDELLPYLDYLILRNIVPETADESRLANLERNVNLDLYFGSSLTARRRVRKHIHFFNQIRGTVRAYHLMFKLIGFDIEITEEWMEYSFDSPVTFDDPIRRFDMGCGGCSAYRIDILGDYWDDVNEVTTITQEQLDAFRSIIIYNQPINATLDGLFIDKLGAAYQILSYDNSYS